MEAIIGDRLVRKVVMEGKPWLTMDKAVKNLVTKVGISLLSAVQMASYNPAKCLGIDDKKGSLELYKDADIVILNKNLETELTMVAGKVVYRKKEI